MKPQQKPNESPAAYEARVCHYLDSVDTLGEAGVGGKGARQVAKEAAADMKPPRAARRIAQQPEETVVASVRGIGAGRTAASDAELIRSSNPT